VKTVERKGQSCGRALCLRRRDEPGENLLIRRINYFSPPVPGVWKDGRGRGPANLRVERQGPAIKGTGNFRPGEAKAV